MAIIKVREVRMLRSELCGVTRLSLLATLLFAPFAWHFLHFSFSGMYVFSSSVFILACLFLLPPKFSENGVWGGHVTRQKKKSLVLCGQIVKKAAISGEGRRKGEALNKILGE